MSIIVDPKFDIDPFGSQIVVVPIGSISYKPTWGISDLRYTTTTTGTGAAATEEGGEFKLSSGTATSNVAKVSTLKRGQYQAGAQARAGVGARIPTAPGSTAVMRWGYFDDNNGFLFGQDATGAFVARRSGGTETKVYQTDWNYDKMQGAGPSGITLDLAKGIICEIDFTWYAYGIIVFQFVLFDSGALTFTKYPAHILKVDNSVSIVDPNQPLTFSVENGASNTTNYDLYIGGHQFEYFAGSENEPEREVAEILTNYTTAANTDWQPLIALRSRSTYGTSGRANSVLSRVVGYFVAADSQMETRLTYGGTTSNLTWGTPTGWTSAESSIETKITGTGGTALATSSAGFPSSYGFVSSTNQANRPIKKSAQLPLSGDIEAILWVRRLSASGTNIVLHANISVEEQH